MKIIKKYLILGIALIIILTISIIIIFSIKNKKSDCHEKGHDCCEKLPNGECKCKDEDCDCECCD